MRAPAAAWDVPGACHGAILSPSDNLRQCGMLQPWRLGRHSSPALPDPARGMRFKPLVQRGAGSLSRVRADGMGVSWSIHPVLGTTGTSLSSTGDLLSRAGGRHLRPQAGFPSPV